jgi:hypothetical protein
MYRHADGRMETADWPLRRHTMFPAKTNDSFNDPLGWNLCVCLSQCNKAVLFQRIYENEVLRIIKHVQINFTFMGGLSIQTTMVRHVMPLTSHYKLKKNYCLKWVEL